MGLKADPEFDILVVAPWGRDAELISDTLRSAGVLCRVCTSVCEAAEGIPERADLLIIVEEVLDALSIQSLVVALLRQPPWSDLPIIVLTGGGAVSKASAELARKREPLGNVALVERPARPVTLVSSVQTALRSRKKQYEIRDHLEHLNQAEEGLRRSHERLESEVAERTATLRRLSASLLRSQDDERRRIARELHDSLGQYLASLAMQLDQLGQDGDIELLAAAQKTLQISISETRTLSHLLHPPLLDEVGLSSAIELYVEGFAQRSGIQVKLEMPRMPRLDKNIETAVFRVLQEALTNIHRHSESRTAEVCLEYSVEQMVLAVRDHGRGISQPLLDRFQISGTGVGVGLAGIRERINELEGDLVIESDAHGTLVKIAIPLRQNAKLA